ncbi:hypothetical protein [Acidisphaera sp. S103]|uniref:hypothetical protein n=1 Tax=Acidisphaera sp. S103 TaxID=1747223 RepID=UPI00131BC7BE|nr:hypothetical protein [Acidisphaera sp. S103]
MFDDENLPTSMTADQAAALLDCVRNPRILRYFVERPLNEMVHELLRAKIEQRPAAEIYVEGHVIGLITALRPVLAPVVATFFDITDQERTQRRMALEEYELAAVAQSDLRADESDDAPNPLGDAWTALDAGLCEMGGVEWKRLALEVVAKPEALIRDVRAIEAFRMVLALMRHGDACLSVAEMETINTVGNAPTLNNLLTVLRDLRRVFR